MRVNIPGFGSVDGLSPEGVDRVFGLVAKLDREPLDLSQQHPEPDPEPVQQYYADDYIDLAVPAQDFGQAFELAAAAESTRLAQDAKPPARRDEDRVADAVARAESGTLTPQGQFARSYGMSNEPGNCGASDFYGRCAERFHAHNCASSAETGMGLVYAENGTYRDKARSPVSDSRGLTWQDQHGGTMSMTDHVEALTGIRQADSDPFSPNPRRDLVQAARPFVLGDPSDPDATAGGFPRSTMTTAAALARQANIQTPADARAQLAAHRAEYDRQMARYRPPRHADYSPPASRQHQPVQLRQVDAGWNGSVPTYAAGGTVPADGEWDYA